MNFYKVISYDNVISREESLMILRELDNPHYPPVLYPHSKDKSLWAVSGNAWIQIHSTLTLDEVRAVWKPIKIIPVTALWKVKSDRTDEMYTVRKQGNNFYCSCMGFIKHKHCKHVDRKKAELQINVA